MDQDSCFFFSSRRRHTRSKRDWSSDVCSSDLDVAMEVDRVAVADDGSRWLGEYSGVLIDLPSLHSAGLIAAPCELLRMLAIILADAEDVAPRRDRGKELDAVQRNLWPLDLPEPTDFVVSLDEFDHVVNV